MTSISLQALNRMETAGAVERLGHLFEHSPWVVAETWDRRPFTTVEEFHRALCATMRAAPDASKLALIRAHPDLVGKAALAGMLTPSSGREQRAAGLGTDDLSPDEIAAFTIGNAAYTERFGFPFVICARENRKARILAGLAERLNHDRETEIATALGQIELIALYRLLDVVADDRESDVDATAGEEGTNG
ncbi:MAG: 2-oxo-4-hydroxy-4-carboxy-5-ureidoimidazoline decarboxylase [Chloroflexia bacterium]|nr:2-oxo-4-hydroxy-4-carboxy-5-ureidoimidazoline decarboxylase [Chloroflexia bacterium]